MGQCQGTKEIRLEKAGEIQEKSGQVCEKKRMIGNKELIPREDGD